MRTCLCEPAGDDVDVNRPVNKHSFTTKSKTLDRQLMPWRPVNLPPSLYIVAKNRAVGAGRKEGPRASALELEMRSNS